MIDIAFHLLDALSIEPGLPAALTAVLGFLLDVIYQGKR